MVWKKIAFARFSTFFIAGIISSWYFPCPVFLRTGLLICIFLLLLLHFLPWKQVLKPYKSVLPLLFLFFAGGVNMEIHKIKNVPRHFSKFSFHTFKATVESEAAPTQSGTKSILQVNSVLTKTGWKPATGKVICFFGFSFHPEIGKTLVLNNTPKPIEAPLNPEEFNYKEYMAFNGISHFCFLKKEAIAIEPGKEKSLKQLAGALAGILETQIDKFIQDTEAAALVKGLTLGQRTDLSSETKTDFSKAGLAHILAVSGSHVVLVFQLIAVLFAFLKRSASGRVTFVLVAVALLWLYAFMTGLSPSAIRATIMFSIFLFTGILKRETNSIHSLFLTIFLILLFDPLTLFNLGFQLSVLAVLGIILYTKKISALFQTKHIVLKKTGELIALSCAAQVFTFPLVILYFKSFPVYFIPSNLLATIPTILIVYATFIMLLLGSVSNGIGLFLGKMVKILAVALLSIAHFFSKLPSLTSINLSLLQMLTLFAGIFLLIAAFSNKKNTLLKISLGCFVLFSFSLVISLYIQSQQKKMVVFNVKKNTVIALINGFQATIFHSNPLTQTGKIFKYKIQPYISKTGVKQIRFQQESQNFNLFFFGKKIEVTNDIAAIKNANIVVFKNLRKKQIPQIKKIKKPIIFDATSMWAATKTLHLKGFKTWEEGAFIVDLKN